MMARSLLGHVGVSKLLPDLAAFPASQVPPTTAAGSVEMAAASQRVRHVNANDMVLRSIAEHESYRLTFFETLGLPRTEIVAPFAREKGAVGMVRNELSVLVGAPDLGMVNVTHT